MAPGEIAYDTNAGHARLWAVLHALIAEGADVGYFGVWPLAHRRYADAMDELGVRLLGERQPMIDLPAEVAERREPRNATARRFTDVLAAFAPTHVYFYLHFTAVELLDLARSAAAGAAHLLDAVDVLFRQDWGSQGSPMPEPDELALYRRCNAVLVDSHADAVALRSRHLRTPVIVAPLAYEARPGAGWEEREGLVFVGTSAHPPNADAARWLVTEILPDIRRSLAVTTTIVGADRDGLYGDLAGPDVDVLGWVPDLGQVLDRHRLAVAPLRQGGGLRGKVLEALSVGLPVIATNVATYGIPAIHGGGSLGVAIPPDPELFAERVVSTYRDDGAWQDQRDRGLALVRDHFSPRRVRTAVRSVLAVTGAR